MEMGEFTDANLGKISFASMRPKTRKTDNNLYFRGLERSNYLFDCDNACALSPLTLALIRYNLSTTFCWNDPEVYAH